MIVGILLAVLSWTDVSYTVDWARLARAVQGYERAPGPEATAGIRKLLPPEGRRVRFGDSAGSEAFYQALEHALPTFQRRREARDREAVRLGFDLRRVADGGLLEDLEVVLGALVRIDPRLFLLEVSARKGPGSLGVVAVLGPVFVDKEDAVVCAEVARRIDALESVKDESLLAVQREAVEYLRKTRPRCASRS
jgi:hypothetical protein